MDATFAPGHSTASLTRAPGPISTFEWSVEDETLYIAGEDANEGVELVLFIPGNRPNLNVSFTGIRDVETTGVYGGRRITAKATGGAWSIDASE